MTKFWIWTGSNLNGGPYLISLGHPLADIVSHREHFPVQDMSRNPAEAGEWVRRFLDAVLEPRTWTESKLQDALDIVRHFLQTVGMGAEAVTNAIRVLSGPGP